MDEFKIFYDALLQESPTLIVVALFFLFGLIVIRALTPAGKRFGELADKFIDGVAKPLIPVTEGAVAFLSVQGKSMEAWARSNQQLVDVVQEQSRTNRDYYETRIAQEKMEREAQVNELRQQLRDRDVEVARLTKENVDLKEKVRQLEKELSGKQDKASSNKKNAKGD
jgi:predicted RNase H-like nuclease (RuvC/YqgF family)